ncbi:MAG: nuclear transport factor 2 family protein [Amphritea sp.]
MNKTEFVEKLYQCVDDRNVQALSAFLAPDVSFRFANAEPLKGKEAVLEANKGFFASIAAMSHRIDSIWVKDDDLICNGQVNYTRLDASKFSAPFATILKVKDEQIIDYLIYADVSGL